MDISKAEGGSAASSGGPPRAMTAPTSWAEPGCQGVSVGREVIAEVGTWARTSTATAAVVAWKTMAGLSPCSSKPQVVGETVGQARCVSGAR